MKDIKYNFLKIASICLLAVISLFLNSCSPRITGEIYKKNVINAGDSTVLSWHFKDAERVKFNWGKNDYNIIDSIKVAPLVDSKYYIVAYQSNFDSLTLTYDVITHKEVLPEQKPASDIIRGPVKHRSDIKESFDASEYFIGMTYIGNYAEPAKYRVLNTIYNQEKSSVILRGIVLDDNGNFISGLNNFKESINFNSEVKCLDQSAIKITSEFTESKDPDNIISFGLNILLDNSAVAVNNQPVLDQIKDFIKNRPGSDEIGLTAYNQESKTLLKLDQVSNYRDQIDKLNIEKPNGLNSIFKTTTEVMTKFKTDKSDLKAIIIILYSADNASLVYDANDVVNVSKENAIPVYIIGVGDAVESYFLRYLSIVTGGKYYHIFDEDLPHLGNILNEIANSQRNYYQIEVPIDKNMISCNDLKMNISLKYDDRDLRDSLQLAFNQREQYSQYQSIALFDSTKTDFSDVYLGNIKALAKVLEVNPEAKVELIGNSSKEFDNDSRNEALSNLRAKEVKNFLVSLGANGDQIVTKGIGRSKPLYYLEQQNWQADFNRRVEVRWLAPSVYPYEIIAEIVKSEDDALNYIDKWEKNGYKAYFDRFLENDIPFYRIKLWGYSTLPEAEEEMNKLKKKNPKIKFTIE